MPDFTWPHGARFAVSLSFDDARPSQLDHGLPILQRHGVRATFYISPASYETRAADWAAAATTHEIGNHTYTHPCSCHHRFSRQNALEDYDLPRISADIDRATAFITRHTGRAPTTFAFPCGQDWVGRGPTHASYVPVVAERFRAARCYAGEMANEPAITDPHRLLAVHFDSITVDQAMAALTAARQLGGWLLFAGHDIGPEPRYQQVLSTTLDAVCAWCTDPRNGAWIATVHDIATHLHQETR